METIEIVYKPVGGSNGVYYHKTLIYTDSTGHKEYVRSGPSIPLTSVSNSILGKIHVDSGEYQEGTPDYVNPLSDTRHREEVDSGSDLSAKWADLVASMHDMEAYDYMALHQNSNTSVDVALRDNGYDLPEDDDYGEYYSPASLEDSGQYPLYDFDPFFSWSIADLIGGLGATFFLDRPPPGLRGAQEPFLAAPLSHESPLILDLNGDGIETTSRHFTADSDGSIYFDLNADGFAERTNWISGGDGLLAWDRNTNGSIDDGSELFGNTGGFADGFAALADLDSNSDGHITSADADWSSLRVWIDANADGASDPGELVTLPSLLITDIDLGSTPLYNTYSNDNLVSATSTFTMSGNTADIADVWFRTDMMDSRSLSPVELDEAVLFLPVLKGYGTLEDLSVAMSSDTDLLELVQTFTAEWSMARFGDEAALDSDMRDILFKWASVDGVSPTSRGAYVDAQELEFLEKFFGQTYSEVNLINHHDDPGGYGPGAIPDVFEHLFNLLKASIIVQLEGDALFESPALYMPNGEVFAGALSQEGIDALQAEAALAPDAEEYWLAFTRFIAAIRDVGSFDSAEETALNSAIHDTLPLLSWDDLTSEVIEFYGYTTNSTEFSNYRVGTWQEDNLNSGDSDDLVYGLGADDEILVGGGDNIVLGGYGDDYILALEGADILLGESGADSIVAGGGADHLDGGAGNDGLWGEAGNDLLVGGTGNDDLDGGTGDDTYVIGMGDGNDVISEALDGAAGNDTIRFAEGVELSDLTFSRSVWSLVIHVGASGTITLTSHFADAEVNSDVLDEIDTLTFADSSTFSLLSGFTFTGTSGNDSVYGTLYDDTLDGGEGSDSLEGGDGADTFLFAANQIGSSDTVADFSLMEDDKIDVGYLLESFEPLSSTVTDFVQITTSGSNSLLYVDVDGGADNFVQIATILGVTGLTDEAALVTNGTLLVESNVPLEGLKASYFTLGSAPSSLSSVDFEDTPDHVEIVGSVDFNDAWNVPFYTSGPLDNFAAQFAGYLSVETAGLYSFSLRSDDGSALWIDGVKVIDNDGLHGAQTVVGQTYLAAGLHALTAQYIEAGGDQILQMSWNGADTSNSTVIIDGTALAHDGDPQNTMPVAFSDVVSTDVDTAKTFDVTANDFDADTDTVHVSAVTQGDHGTVVKRSKKVALQPCHSARTGCASG